MSAENELAVFPMANGEIWIAKRRCGDTFPECWGEVTDVIVKCATYEDAAAQFAAVSDRRSPRYVYTEYGGDMPSRKEFKKERRRFLVSDVVVGFSRECGCVDVRDIGVERWRVVERDRGSREERVVMECIGYAEAITLAHLYGREQPGECAVHVPKAFLRFEDYERHDCLGEGSDLALPPGYGE